MKKIITILLIVGLIFSGCKSQTDTIQPTELTNSTDGDIFQEQQVAEDFYNKLKKKDYNSTMQLFHQDTFKMFSEEAIINLLKEVEDNWGVVKSYSIAGVQLTGNSNGEKYITMQYTVNRSINTTYETIILLNSKSDKDFLIITYGADPYTWN